MSNIENESRAQFEAMFPRPSSVNWSERLQRYGSNDMTFTCVQVFLARWEAWQASRQALVIELPEYLDTDRLGFPAYDAEEVDRAIESQGVKCK